MGNHNYVDQSANTYVARKDFSYYFEPHTVYKLAGSIIVIDENRASGLIKKGLIWDLETSQILLDAAKEYQGYISGCEGVDRIRWCRENSEPANISTQEDGTGGGLKKVDVNLADSTLVEEVERIKDSTKNRDGQLKLNWGVHEEHER